MSELAHDDRSIIDELYDLFEPPRLRFCPLSPIPRQEAFLMLKNKEVFYGGAAAGGKTAALLMSALQYCDVPGYHALLLRFSLAELRLPGNLIELSHQWLSATKATWSGEENTWRFPGRGPGGSGGASLTFGYLADDGDVRRYAGTSFSYLGFDELSCFSENRYRLMQRALRQPTGITAGVPAQDGTRLVDVPVRIRSAGNPGGPYREWINSRFVDPTTRAPGVIFLPARLEDNPHVDYESYKATLEGLPPAERERLLNGDWNMPDDGQLFTRSWFTVIEPHQLPEKTAKVRYWDLAASEPSPGYPDPDYTVGLRLELDPTTGVFYVSDLIRVRKAPGAVEQLVRATADLDGRDVAIVIEQEGGGAGKALTDRYTRQLLRGFNARADRVTGAKYLRAQPVAAAAENGTIRIVRNQHTTAFLDELTSFPNGRHKDCVDALAGAHSHVSKTPAHRSRSLVPRGRIPTSSDNAGRHPFTYRSAPPRSFEELAASLGAVPYDTTKRRHTMS